MPAWVVRPTETIFKNPALDEPSNIPTNLRYRVTASGKKIGPRAALRTLDIDVMQDARQTHKFVAGL